MIEKLKSLNWLSLVTTAILIILLFTILGDWENFKAGLLGRPPIE